MVKIRRKMCVWPLARRSGLGLRLWIVWPLRVLVSLRGVNQLPMFGPLSPAQMRRPSSNEGKRRHPNPRSDMPPGSGGHRGPPRPNDCHCRMTLMPRAPLIVGRLGSLSCAGACGLNLKKISSHVILFQTIKRRLEFHLKKIFLFITARWCWKTVTKV